MGAAQSDGTKGEIEGGWNRVFPGYTPTQLFALVSGVENYPRFIPGCVAARVVERNGDQWLVDNVFHVGPIRSRFKSFARLESPHRLSISAEDGPWKMFRLVWTLDPDGDGCRVSCDFSVSFSSRAVAAVARLGVGEMDRRIIASFEKQALTLYGPQSR